MALTKPEVSNMCTANSESVLRNGATPSWLFTLVLVGNCLPCYIIILIADFSFFFFFLASFPLGNMWNYRILTYVKCICYIRNRADVYKGIAILLNKRRLGWSSPPWLSSLLTCQPAPWLCVVMPNQPFLKQNSGILLGIAHDEDCFAKQCE